MTKNYVVILSSVRESLEAALRGHRYTATVEAEYGDQVVRGSVATLAHHGSRAGNPCPCLASNDVARPACTCGVGCPVDGFIGEGCDAGRGENDLLAIGVSHVDLDCLGGIAALLGRRPTYDDPRDGEMEFWQLAAFVDVNGPHKIEGWRAARFFEVWKSGNEDEADFADAMSDGAVDALNAWWAWAKDHRAPAAPRDGSVLDITAYVEEAIRILWLIAKADDSVPGTKELYAAGRAFAESKRALNESSFVRMEGDVILRRSNEFVNLFYDAPDGKVGKAVVALVKRSPDAPAAVTISLADPIPGVSCAEIVRKLWGPQAGGRDVVAGSPRDRDMTVGDAEEAFNALRAAIAERQA